MAKEEIEFSPAAALLLYVPCEVHEMKRKEMASKRRQRKRKVVRRSNFVDGILETQHTVYMLNALLVVPDACLDLSDHYSRLVDCSDDCWGISLIFAVRHGLFDRDLDSID